MYLMDYPGSQLEPDEKCIEFFCHKTYSYGVITIAFIYKQSLSQ